MSHVDEGRLHALLDGALSAADPADAERVELHLAACADCRARLEEASRLRDEASGLLGIAQPRVAATPSFDAIRARADAIAAEQGTTPARTSAERRRALLATPFNGFAWAATIVVAVGLGWMLRDNIGEGDRVALSAGADQAVEAVAVNDAAGESAVAEEGAASSSPTAEMDAPADPVATDGRPPLGFQARTPPPVAPTGAVAREESRVQATLGAGAAETRAAEPRAADYDVVGDEFAATVDAPGELAAQTAAPVRLESARAPAAPPPGMADMAGAGAGESDDGWRDVTLAEAERSTDGGVLRLPGARIERVAMRSGAAEVRTVQITERGESVQVVQRRIFESAERRARESAMAEAPAAANSAKPAATVHVDDWTVTITGATQARLEELARSLD